MRFTATAKYSMLARAAAKNFSWTVFVRKATALSDALGTGTWTEVTYRLLGIPDFSSRLESDIGQSMSDAAEFRAKDIAWWDANIFNATASEYLEIKVLFTLAQGSDVCTDTVYAFWGFIDKAGVYRSELEDSVSFTAYSADDLASRLSMLNVATKYIREDITGTTDALILPRIPGLYVTDANITSYVLRVGLHTIDYEYNSGTEQARLDGGDWVTLPATDGEETLINADGDQKVKVYAKSSGNSELSTTADMLTDYIIVKVAGDTLPYQPYFGLSTKALLTLLYAQIGITTVTFDTLEFDSHDDTKRISFLEYPPMDASVIGFRSAMAASDTSLYIACGAKIYARTMATGAYALLTTLTSGAGSITIKRMWYNYRSPNADLWCFYTNATNGDCARKYRINGGTWSAEVVLNASGGAINEYSTMLIDYNYTGSSYKYGLLYYYPEDPTKIRFLDESTNTTSAVYSYGAGVKSIQFSADFMFEYSSGHWWFLNYYDAILGNAYAVFNVDSGGSFVLDGTQPSGRTTWPQYSRAVYHAVDDKIYYFEYNVSPSPASLKSHPRDNTGETTVLADQNFNYTKQALFYYDGHALISIGDIAYAPTYTGKMYAVVNNVATEMEGTIFSVHYPFAVFDSVAYGCDALGRLFKWDSSISMYLAPGDPSGLSVRDMFTKIYGGYNLLGKVSSVKAAAVYRRGDSDGNPQDSGNSLAVTITDVSRLDRIERYVEPVALVEVYNGEHTATYNGTDFNVEVLSDIRRLQIENSWLPTNILDDIANYFYQFFSVARDLYTLRLGLVPLFQYEIFDECSVTLTTTKIQKTAAGPIYGEYLGADGSLEVEVLL